MVKMIPNAASPLTGQKISLEPTSIIGYVLGGIVIVGTIAVAMFTVDKLKDATAPLTGGASAVSDSIFAGIGTVS